ncbi:MAG: DUF5678 domain-containing protein [Candidatus Thermoplasmatota archaeon]
MDKNEPIVRNFAKIQMEYGGQYIAIWNNKIVAHAKTFNETNKLVDNMRLPYKGELVFRYIQPKRE